MLCAALVILALPASALEATFRVHPSRSGYNASVQVEESREYFFWDVGPLGERVPKKVENVSLTGDCGDCSTGDCGNCSFTFAEPYHITFPEGNYTVHYGSSLADNHLSASFTEPYHVTVFLPGGVDLRNPLLGGMSPTADSITEENGELTAAWNRTRGIDIRFYDGTQETMLLLFGTVWLPAVVVTLASYLMVRRRRGDGK